MKKQIVSLYLDSEAIAFLDDYCFMKRFLTRSQLIRIILDDGIERIKKGELNL